MPLFAIIAHDRADAGPLRAETRPAHLDHLAMLGDRFDRAGPLIDAGGRATGSLILARFDDLAAARAFADADPYAAAGLFESVTVSEWRQAVP